MTTITKTTIILKALDMQLMALLKNDLKNFKAIAERNKAA